MTEFPLSRKSGSLETKFHYTGIFYLCSLIDSCCHVRLRKRMISWSQVKPRHWVCFCSCLLLLAWSNSKATSPEAVASDLDCSEFRGGELRHNRIVDFDLSYPEKAHHETAGSIDLYYDPRYEVVVGPRPDGLPSSSILFEVNYETSKPVSYKERSKIQPSDSTHFSLLLSANKAKRSLEYMIPVYAGSFESKEFYPTDQKLGSYTKLDVPGGRLLRPNAAYQKEIYAKFDSAGEVIESMVCTVPGDVPNPSCSFSFKTDTFSVKVSLVRRNEAHKFKKIRETVDRFLGCLSVGEEHKI